MRWTTTLNPADLLADLLLLLIVLVVFSRPFHLVSAQSLIPAREDLPPFLLDIKSSACVASADNEPIYIGGRRKDLISYLVKASVVYLHPDAHPAWTRTLDVKKDLKHAAAACAEWVEVLNKQIRQRQKEKT